jgi:hypothetical protein
LARCLAASRFGRHLMSSMLTIREVYEAKAMVGSRKIVATLVATARTSAEVTTALNRSGLP